MIYLPLQVRAATITECQALIDHIRAVLDGVEIGGGNPDRTRASLESKLGGAKIKLDQNKADDALQKLRDFADQVIQLRDAPKPKINPLDAQDLLDAMGDAIACVEALIAQSA